MLIPNPLGSKFITLLGSLLLGGVLISTTAGSGQTPMNGGSVFLPDFNATGTPSTTAKVPMLVPFNAILTNTGSATVKVNGGVKYAAFCIPNPLTKLGTNYGSGS